MINSVKTHLKDACQLTAAKWAVLADCERGLWFVDAAHCLPKSKQPILAKFLAQEAISARLNAALLGDDVRSVSLAEEPRLGVPRMYVFPLAEVSEVILVGAIRQNATERHIWRLVAGLLPSLRSEDPYITYLPNLQTELTADMPRALDRVLGAFVRAAKLQGAWLAIRRGDALDIAAQWNDPRLAEHSLSLETSRLLRRINRSLTEVVALKGQADWDNLPHPVRKSTICWACFPLIIGQRWIGAIAVWGQREFLPSEMKKLRVLAGPAAHSVEVIVTFNELTGHLGRLAMLNDFALAISSAQNLDQIARRVFGYLARSFRTELIALYLPAMDGGLMREFRNRDGKFSSQSTAVAGHHILPFLKDRIRRLSDTAPEFKPVYAGARSGLLVPLKYRSQTIGLLALESTRPDAFSQYDEYLMVVIASHLAGLIEYGRLREGAEARARNLGLIHEVIQQVIGLNDKQQVARIAADLLAQYFAYELAGVMLVGDDSSDLVLGFGGSHAEFARNAAAAGELDFRDGVVGRVFRTGESLLVNDASRDKLHKELPGWNAASEMCVPLKDGDRILGLIDVESSRRNAFNNNDVLAMESLAGVLVTVVSSANQYERLQETIHQLRAAQIEARARLVAQQEAEHRLVQAAKLVAVGEMAAGIAHELNNPLTTVTGFAELILDELPKDAAHRADVEMVLREALRARGVVRRLLDFARQGERSRVRSDINEIVDDVLALTKHFIHTSGVQLGASFERELPWVSVDNNQMKQVFLNLVHNALQAMPTGGRLQIVTETRLKDEREWVVVAVKDSGIGIDTKDIDRIFEPFFTTKANRGGTGLGLSVTYGIVTDHGGRMEVESEPGEGSTFAVWLPV